MSYLTKEEIIGIIQGQEWDVMQNTIDPQKLITDIRGYKGSQLEPQVRQGVPSADVCEWEYNKNTFELYNTTCGQALNTEIGRYKYCPYCGGKIKEKRQ